MRSRLLILLAVGAMACIVTNIGLAQQPCPVENWSYSFTPYIWLSGINGNVAVRGVPATINASFSDLKDNLDGAFEFHFEAQKGGWGYFIDPTYVRLSADAASNGQTASIDFTQWIVEFGGTRRIGGRPVDYNGKSSSVDLLFGGRYWNLSSKVNVSNIGEASGTQDWVDPIIGIRYQAGLSRLWNVSVRGDIGGFGVGSDFSWNVVLLAGYNTSPNGRVYLGYRLLGVDRESGSGADYFKYDVTYRGPILGYSFLF